ncbi:CASP-like protein [Trema orientale]|uniref:CASP-like protein n=1 Tax=Trema orientale TaxID=63057 RepID=A0A2P5C581_TREOI|nr:CASP-like protein [Trema orientale]
MTVNTETTLKNDEEEEDRAQDQYHEHEHEPEQHPQKQGEEEEEEERRVKRIISDSPHSSLSLSPLSNRSYKTPSPSADHPGYFDQAHEPDGFAWTENKPTKPPSSLVQPNRSFPAEPLVVTKALDPEPQDAVVSPLEDVQEPDASAGAGNGSSGGLGSFNRRKLRPDLSSRKRTRRQHGLVKRVLLGFRISGFVFCLISFAVMAANRNQGWALDSFYRYKEFRYCLGVNVMGFAYSGLQVFDLIYFLSTEKHLIQHHLRYYFDFFMDQASQ